MDQISGSVITLRTRDDMVEIMNFSMFLPEKAGAAVALCTIPGELLPVQITQKLTHKPQTVNGR